MSEFTEEIEYTTRVEDLNAEELEVERKHNFYDLVRKRDDMTVEVKPNRLKIRDLLLRLGYIRHDIELTYKLVRVEDGRIEVISEERMKDDFERYVVALPTRKVKVYGKSDGEMAERNISAVMILDKLFNNFDNYLNVSKRLFPEKALEIQEDEKHKKYFFFRNTALMIDESGIHKTKYCDLKKLIWKTSVHDRDFIYTDEPGEFERFINNITGNDANRKLSLMTMLGYLMHSNVECERRMVLLTDANRDNPGQPSGGTGKGIIGKALGMMMNNRTEDKNYISVDGKTFMPGDEKKYMNGDINTRLIHIEDIKRNTPLEPLYTDITEGAPIRHLFKATIRVPSKFMCSTNQTIRIESTSDRRRIYLFELENYYNENFTPETEFGHRFFESEWPDMEWCRFDSFMARCAHEYMKRGVVRCEELNYSDREIIEHTNEQFAYWFADFVRKYLSEKREKDFAKNVVLSLFIDDYPEFKTQSWFSQKVFTKWISAYCDKKNIPYCTMRSTSDLIIFYPTSETKEKALKQKKL